MRDGDERKGRRKSGVGKEGVLEEEGREKRDGKYDGKRGGRKEKKNG